jgi:hypothetical protein
VDLAITDQLAVLIAAGAIIVLLLAQGQTPQLRNGNGNGAANGGNRPENS